jgi:demethylmenaquinone methyltransferase/2-methoxy-6-polyprenyl-1,4-benzoquinol methylase
MSEGVVDERDRDLEATGAAGGAVEGARGDVLGVAADTAAPESAADAGRAAGEGASAVRSGNTVPPPSVTAMFDRIAPVYDRLNTLMTFGQDGRWRRAAVDACGLRPGDRAIDVACGTGRLTIALAERVGPFGRVVGVDRSTGMIELARAAARDLVQVEFVVADALALPVEDGSFDAATIAFGLRNLPDFEAGFRELARVVRPGGRVVCLELTQPRPAIWAKTFRALFGRLAPLAGRLYGVGDTYRYLPESLDGFPDAPHLAAIMRRAGLVDVRIRRFGLATVALHVGRVPPRD